MQGIPAAGLAVARRGNAGRVKGYDVVSSEGRKVGTVVGASGDYLVVETGLLRRRRHALPKAFAHPVDADRVVRATVSRRVVVESPRVDDGWDERAVARHYGLAAGERAPETAGEGELLPTDPAESSSVEGARHGVEPADQARAEIREGRRDVETPAVHDRPATAVDPFGQTANR